MSSVEARLGYSSTLHPRCECADPAAHREVLPLLPFKAASPPPLQGSQAPLTACKTQSCLLPSKPRAGDDKQLTSPSINHPHGCSQPNESEIHEEGIHVAVYKLTYFYFGLLLVVTKKHFLCRQFSISQNSKKACLNEASFKTHLLPEAAA